MSLGRKMVAGSLWCFLDGWASEIANLAVFLILVRLLGPEEFGLVALAAVFTTVGTDLVGYSVSQVLVQRRELSPGLCDTVFYLVLALATGTATLLVLAAPWVGALFDAPELGPLLRWLSVTVILHGIATVPLALLTREMRFDVIAKRSLVMIGGGGLVGIGLALAGYGAWALVGQALTQAGISVVMLYRAAGWWRPGRRAAWRHLVEIRAYASGIVGNRIVGVFDERAPQFIIGLVIGPAAVGYFNVAMRLIEILIRMFVVPTSQVALPGIAQVQEDPTRVRGIMETGIATTSLVSAPAFFGTFVIAPELVPLALGPDWLPITPVLQLLAVRGLVWPIVLYGNSLLYGLGRPAQMLRLNLCDLAVNVVTLGLAAPFGLTAVAAASSLRVLLLRWPLIGRAIGQLTGLTLRRQAALMAPAFAAGGIMAALLLVWRDYLAVELNAPALLAALVAMGALAYTIVASLLNPGLARHLAELRAGLRRSDEA